MIPRTPPSTTAARQFSRIKATWFDTVGYREDDDDENEHSFLSGKKIAEFTTTIIFCLHPVLPPQILARLIDRVVPGLSPCFILAAVLGGRIVCKIGCLKVIL